MPGYVLIAHLGTGASATVWHARRQADGVDVALKLMACSAPEALARAQRECEALVRVGPPHVPELLDHGELPGSYFYIAMRGLPGDTLRAHLERATKPLPLERVIALADAILAGLEAVHAAGLVHRDLKPENIFVSADTPPRAMLLDFGLVHGAEHAPGLTKTGAVMGTVLYMAPEQFERAEIDSRADIYAFGVILYELLTLRPLFEGTSAELQMSHQTRRPPLPSSIVPVASALDEVVLGCLSKQPEQRFPSATVVRTELARAAAAAATQRSAPPVPAPGQPPIAMQTERSAPYAAGAEAASQVQKVALVFLEASPGAGMAIRSMLETAGGHLAHFAGKRHVGVVTHTATENPLRRAIAVAQHAWTAGLCRSAIVDLDEVRVRLQSGAAPRFLARFFSDPQRFPGNADPDGVIVTGSAAAAVPDLHGAPVAARMGAFVLTSDNSAGMTLADMRAHSLLGRDEILKDLRARWQDAVRQGLPTLITVLAEPGYGKSHLARTFAAQVARSTPVHQCIELAAQQPVGSSSAPLLRELLVRLLGLPAEAPEDMGRMLLADALGAELAAELWQGVALVMGWRSDEGDAASGFDAAPSIVRRDAARAAAAALRRRAEAQPLILIVDDAHWAEDSILDAVEHATRMDSSDRLFCLVLAQPSLLTARPQWGQQAGHYQMLRLERLQGVAARALCRHLLWPAENVPEAILDALIARTDGIPLLLVELVRGLVRRGLLRPRSRGQGCYVDTDVLDELPDQPLIEWFAQREIEALHPDQVPYLHVAALLGRELDADVLAAVIARLEAQGDTSEFPLDARVVLEQMVARGLMAAHGPGVFGFRHELIRNAIATAMAPPLAARIHGAAYEHYCNALDMRPEERLPRLAWHAAQHGARSAALEAYATLAEEARQKHDELRAEGFFTRVLELAEDTDGKRRLWAHRGRADTRLRLARYEAALADCGQARRIARELGDREAEVAVLLDEAMAHDWLEAWQQSRACAEEARALLAQVHAPLLEARLRMSLGRSAARLDTPERALPLLQEAAVMAEALGDRGYEILMIALLLQAPLLAWTGRLDESEQVFERVIALCREHRDFLHLASALGNRVHLWAPRGNWKRLFADLEEQLELARILGNPLLERNYHFNLAVFHYWRGNLGQARTHAQRVIALDQRRIGPEARPEGKLLLARIALADGDITAVHALVDEIRYHQAWAVRGNRPESRLVPSDQVLLDMVALAIADGTTEQWDLLIERARNTVLDQEFIEILDVKARTFLARGDVDRARTAWQAAQDAARWHAVLRVEQMASTVTK